MGNKKILVSGANGQLGRSFQKIASIYPSFDFHFFNSKSLDITQEASISNIFDAISPDFFINCAAYTQVDKAESESEKAYAINANSLKHICKEVKKHNCFLFHYSSDYVYHSNIRTPLKEHDITTPSGIYAKSKLAGEQVILESKCPSIILRTSWVYSEFGNNFVKTMIRLGKSRKSLSVVNDQIGAPTYATDIATTTLSIINSLDPKNDALNTIYNYTSEGEISWNNFAQFIFEVAKIDVDVKSIPSSEYPTPAERPKWSKLDMIKIKRKLGIAPKYWKDGVKEVVHILLANENI